MGGSIAVVGWCETKLVDYDMIDEITGRSYSKRGSPCEDGYLYIPIAFLVLLYLVYFVECWYCDVRMALQYREKIGVVYERITQMREAYPVVWWRAISYHYARHTRHVTRYRYGDSYTSTQEYIERINTHSAASAFDFSDIGVKDVSKNLTGLEEYCMTQVVFSKTFIFANVQAENEYLSQRFRFFNDNDGRDEYMETREGLSLTDIDFSDETVSYAYSDKLPWYFNLCVYWTLSLVLLSWPYRVLIEYKIAHVHYQVEKIFGTNFAFTYPNDRLRPGRNRTIPRDITVSSESSMEQTIRNNKHVIPSYSEALLMDAVNAGRGATSANGRSRSIRNIRSSSAYAMGNNNSYGSTTMNGQVFRSSQGHLSLHDGGSQDMNANRRLTRDISSFICNTLGAFMSSEDENKRRHSKALKRKTFSDTQLCKLTAPADELDRRSLRHSVRSKRTRGNKRNQHHESLSLLSPDGAGDEGSPIAIARPTTLPIGSQELTTAIHASPPPCYDVAMNMLQPNGELPLLGASGVTKNEPKGGASNNIETTL
ncbi:transmembrane protein 151B-like [Anneissia japonica]|uniref:transmembrane protein 151B-like n=1 Tax=Anneissia japonica TaxID=1529436 RepID=UPI00142577B4|nr:transmembrane protein 151B-like [Anneissia japonica]